MRRKYRQIMLVECCEFQVYTTSASVVIPCVQHCRYENSVTNTPNSTSILYANIIANNYILSKYAVLCNCAYVCTPSILQIIRNSILKAIIRWKAVHACQCTCVLDGCIQYYIVHREDLMHLRENNETMIEYLLFAIDINMICRVLQLNVYEIFGWIQIRMIKN